MKELPEAFLALHEGKTYGKVIVKVKEEEMKLLGDIDGKLDAIAIAIKV